MKKPFTCYIGLHKWYVTPAVYKDAKAERLSLALQESTRECLCCGKVQRCDRVLLGLNPPEYFEKWYTIHEKPKNIVFDKK